MLGIESHQLISAEPRACTRHRGRWRNLAGNLLASQL